MASIVSTGGTAPYENRLDRTVFPGRRRGQRSGIADTADRCYHGKGGPPFVKLGAMVRYRPADLEAFVQSGLRASTGGGIPVRLQP